LTNNQNGLAQDGTGRHTPGLTTRGAPAMACSGWIRFLAEICARQPTPWGLLRKYSRLPSAFSTHLMRCQRRTVPPVA